MAQTPFYSISVKGSSEDLVEKFQISSFTFSDSQGKDNELRLQITSASPDVLEAEEFVKGTELVFFFGYISGELSAKRLAVVSDIDSVIENGGKTSVTLRAFDKGLFLKKSTSDRVFVKKTASQIAQLVADSLRLEADIKPTTYRYESCPQSNKSDFELLSNLAEREKDYRFGISDNVLSFRPHDYKTPSVLTLSLNSQDSPVSSFRSKINQSSVSPAGKGSKNTTVSADGKVQNVKGDGEDVSLNDHKVIYDSDGKRRTAGEINKTNSIGLKVVSPEADNERREVLANNKVRKEVRQSVTGSLDLVGMPRLTAGQIITIADAGNRTGNYIIESVTHNIGSGYACQVEVKSNALRKPVSKTEPGKVEGKKNKTVGSETIEQKKKVIIYNSDGQQVKSS